MDFFTALGAVSSVIGIAQGVAWVSSLFKKTFSADIAAFRAFGLAFKKI